MPTATRTTRTTTAAEELRALVVDIAEALWPGGDPDYVHDADTTEAIVRAFLRHRPDLMPPEVVLADCLGRR